MAVGLKVVLHALLHRKRRVRVADPLAECLPADLRIQLDRGQRHRLADPGLNRRGCGDSCGASALTRLNCWAVYDGVIRPQKLPEFMAAGGLAAVHYAVLCPW